MCDTLPPNHLGDENGMKEREEQLKEGSAVFPPRGGESKDT